MDYYLHIKTNFECLIKILNKEILLEPQKIYSFLAKKDNIAIFFYPINSNLTSLPFAVNFNISKLQNSKNAQIIKFPNNNYLIEAQPFLINTHNNLGIKNTSVTFGGKTHTIYYSTYSNFNIKVECDSVCQEYYLDAKIIDLTAKTSKNNLLIYCKCQNSKFVVLALEYENEKYSLKTLETVDLLEEENGNILTYKNLNDFAGHGVVTTYDFKKEFSICSNIVYNSTPILCHKKELIPFAFFEAIKVKNYTLAKSYLSQNLAQILSDNHFKNFFGNFCNIIPSLSPTAECNEVALVYKTNNIFEAKVFSLQFNKDNKITNIEQC